MKKIAQGIYKISLGTPEEMTPVKVLKPEMASDSLSKLSDNTCPIKAEEISFSDRAGGCLISLPLKENEQIYGFGLQMKSFRQSGEKKVIRVNSDPVADLGDSHAPVPFYVSTAGYAVFVDTARYATFHCGGCKRKGSRQEAEDYKSVPSDDGYHFEHKSHSGDIFVQIPSAHGADIYIFAGDNMLDAVCRYNLFSGGGVLPPLWGLGILYRGDWHANQDEIIGLAKKLRDDEIPCDVFGLEPGWQTTSYSCSYVWDNERFPDPPKMISDMRKMGYKMNLWEHAYTNPQSPIFDRLYPYSGDSYVWDGLVPDFSLPEARDIFASHHDKLVEDGISGFKLDECDNGDYISKGNWGFPDFTLFPGGMDGEQMHSLFGLLYQKTLSAPFTERGMRIYGQSRSSHALAASSPYVLYSDLYDHSDFIRGMATAAFSGVLWSPEVRLADSEEELIRRMQAVIFSPQAVLNCYYAPTPPWKQYDYEKNQAGEYLPDADRLTAVCRDILNLRMSLIPYLYTAFSDYHSKGIPPVRPIVMDNVDDKNTYDIWDEFMIGNDLLFAPMVYGKGPTRTVYFPKGKWYDFFTGDTYEGGREYSFTPALEKILLFAKDNSLIPYAAPELSVDTDTIFKLSLRLYGEKGSCRLYCDDGETLDYLENGQKCAAVTFDGINISVDGDISGRYELLSASDAVNFK